MDKTRVSIVTSWPTGDGQIIVRRKHKRVVLLLFCTVITLLHVLYAWHVLSIFCMLPVCLGDHPKAISVMKMLFHQTCCWYSCSYCWCFSGDGSRHQSNATNRFSLVRCGYTVVSMCAIAETGVNRLRKIRWILLYVRDSLSDSSSTNKPFIEIIFIHYFLSLGTG